MFVFTSAKNIPPPPFLSSTSICKLSQRVLYCYPANATTIMSICYARQTFFFFLLVLSLSFFYVCEKQFFWNVCFMVFFSLLFLPHLLYLSCRACLKCCITYYITISSLFPIQFFCFVKVFFSSLFFSA